MLSTIFWNPNPVFFRIPYLNVPVTWYGLCFAFGFWVGYHLFTFMLKKYLNDQKVLEAKGIAETYSEKILFILILSTIGGARIGHILFYEHPLEYIKHPLSILKTWEGGLASHGAIFAILLALMIFHYKHKKMYPFATLGFLLDYLVVPAMFISAMIRVGNFFNQEIIGYETNLPWAILFGTPADGSLPLPRHPTQLYEALLYLILFFASLFVWLKKRETFGRGRVTGFVLGIGFSVRFFIEFLKNGQSVWFDKEGHIFSMGHILTFPILLLCFYLVFGSPRFKKLLNN